MMYSGSNLATSAKVIGPMAPSGVASTMACRYLAATGPAVHGPIKGAEVYPAGQVVSFDLVPVSLLVDHLYMLVRNCLELVQRPLAGDQETRNMCGA